MTYEATTSALPRADPDAPGPWMALPAVALNPLIRKYFLQSGHLGARDGFWSGPDGYMRLVRAGGGLTP
jgi:hypothetical protein